ncbi:hypothetical protein GCM10020370_10410 [Paenibacillus hodogayensis]
MFRGRRAGVKRRRSGRQQGGRAVFRRHGGSERKLQKRVGSIRRRFVGLDKLIRVRFDRLVGYGFARQRLLKLVGRGKIKFIGHGQDGVDRDDRLLCCCRHVWQRHVRFIGYGKIKFGGYRQNGVDRRNRRLGHDQFDRDKRLFKLVGLRLVRFRRFDRAGGIRRLGLEAVNQRARAFQPKLYDRTAVHSLAPAAG